MKKNIINKIKLEKCIFSNKYDCYYCNNNNYENPIEVIEKLNDDKLYKCPSCNSTFIQLNNTNYFLSEPSQQIKNKQLLMEKNKKIKSIIFYIFLGVIWFSFIFSAYFYNKGNMQSFKLSFSFFIISLIWTLLIAL